MLSDNVSLTSDLHLPTQQVPPPSHVITLYIHVTGQGPDEWEDVGLMELYYSLVHSNDMTTFYNYMCFIYFNIIFYLCK